MPSSTLSERLLEPALCVSTVFVRAFGPEPALLLGALLPRSSVAFGGWFAFLRSAMLEATGLDFDALTAARDRLIELGVLILDSSLEEPRAAPLVRVNHARILELLEALPLEPGEEPTIEATATPRRLPRVATPKASPKPAKARTAKAEPKIKPMLKPRARDPYFDAVSKACYGDAVLLKTNRAWVAKAAHELRQAGVEVGLIGHFPAWARERYKPDGVPIAITPSIIVKHWPTYLAERVPLEMTRRSSRDMTPAERQAAVLARMDAEESPVIQTPGVYRVPTGETATVTRIRGTWVEFPSGEGTHIESTKGWVLVAEN
jgi:hypothetical protein